MIEELYAKSAKTNEENNLKTSLDTIAEIYGPDVIQTMAQSLWDIATCIEYLIYQDYGEDVTNVCNRYGILHRKDSFEFRDNVWSLVSSLGHDYVEKMREDISC